MWEVSVLCFLACLRFRNEVIAKFSHDMKSWGCTFYFRQCCGSLWMCTWLSFCLSVTESKVWQRISEASSSDDSCLVCNLLDLSCSHEKCSSGVSFIYNKTNQMHQFPKYSPAWNSTCFGQFLCPSSGAYSLYTRHWFLPYRYEDSLVLLESCLQTCMTYASAECTVNKLLMMGRGTARNM